MTSQLQVSYKLQINIFLQLSVRTLNCREYPRVYSYFDLWYDRRVLKPSQTCENKFSLLWNTERYVECIKISLYSVLYSKFNNISHFKYLRKYSPSNKLNIKKNLYTLDRKKDALEWYNEDEKVYKPRIKPNISAKPKRNTILE